MPAIPIDSDDFTLFGLPQRHSLERARLDERWRSLQAEVHPDRFASQGTAAQRVAMQWAVRVNEAYGRLKDPLTRGAYLCGLRGCPIDTHDNTAMPADFLRQQMEWREALEDARSIEQVQALDDEVAWHEQQWLEQLGRQLDDTGDTAGAAASVRALMFVSRFREDLARRLDAFEP